MGGGASSDSHDDHVLVKYKTFSELVNPNDVSSLYTKGAVLGSGNMATVYEYTHKSTGKKYAAKVVLKKTLSKPSEFTNELEILAHLRGHPHILTLEVPLLFAWSLKHFFLLAFAKNVMDFC